MSTELGNAAPDGLGPPSPTAPSVEAALLAVTSWGLAWAWGWGTAATLLGCHQGAAGRERPGL